MNFFFKDEIVRNLKFKKDHILNAKKFMKNLPYNVEPVFIHIRSGRRNNEYKQFKIFGKVGVDLPDKYFYECIKWFEKHLKSPYPNKIDQQHAGHTEQMTSSRSHAHSRAPTS